MSLEIILRDKMNCAVKVQLVFKSCCLVSCSLAAMLELCNYDLLLQFAARFTMSC